MTDAIYAVVRRKRIRDEYIRHGSSTRWIAKKYGISAREAQRIVRDVRPDQISVFDAE